MKKVIFTLFMAAAMQFGFTQTTYYWVGGTTGVYASSTSWNTMLNGSGMARTTPANTDNLIFDGTNIGGATPGVGTVVPDFTGGATVASLKIINASNVVFRRSASGTSSFIINGDGVVATEDFTLDATSTLTITSAVAGNSFGLFLGTFVGLNSQTATNLATGSVAGILNFADGGLASTSTTFRVQNPNSLNILNGAIVNSNLATAANYPFGSNTLSGTINVGSSSNVRGVVFKAGSSFVFKGGVNPYSTSSANPFIFEKGSTFVFEANNPTGILANGRTFANVTVRNNALAACDGNPFIIDTLRIEPGATFNMRVNGTLGITGNIINNGTFGASAPATSAHLVLAGSVPQSLSGTGTFNPIGAISVATDADVTLNTNVNIGSTSGPSSSIVTGRYNVQGFVVGSVGVVAGGAFQLRSAATATSMNVKLTDSSNSVVFTDATAYAAANVSIGNLVTGAGIQPNSYVIATSSGTFTFTLSKPATVTTTTATVTIANNPATLVTSNAGGVDGSIQSTGSKTFGTGANYTFNGATTAPFSLSGNNVVGNITLNANVTTNKNTASNGILTLGAGKLTIRSVDTIRLTNPTAIAGTPFSSSKYISTLVDNTTGQQGVLQVDGITSTYNFPIGSATNYLPATINPSSVSSFMVTAFDGTYTNGTPNGTAFSPLQKLDVVDATWTLNRPSGTGNADVTLNWPATIEGGAFAVQGNSGIGISRYDGTAYVLPPVGNSNNGTNISTATFNSFSPFIVASTNLTLPVSLASFTALVKNAQVELSWKSSTEINLDKYVVERSADGRQFLPIGGVIAKGNSTTLTPYYFTDIAPLQAANYYRLRMVDKNGDAKYSPIISLQVSGGKKGMVVMNNPVIGNEINLLLQNLPKDSYVLTMYNQGGQLLQLKNINHDGGTSTQSLLLPSGRANGVYLLRVSSKTTQYSERILVGE